MRARPGSTEISRRRRLLPRCAGSCRRRAAWLLSALLLWLPLSAQAANHVRVVLDTSLSMSKQLRDGTGPNDPGRLAALATMLLYDLVDPNPQRPGHPDSFIVLPFKSDWPRWTDPIAPPPEGTGTPVVATDQTPDARQAFAAALNADKLPYDGKWTYFYPGLRAALDSVLVAGSDPDDRRVLVLVTDGVPEPEVRAREQALLLELRSELLRRNVQLYVLAFGPSASRERDFFDALYAGQDGGLLGALFIDPTGRDLVLNMTRLFAGGFGYSVEPLGTGARQRDLDLDGNLTPPKVALVALRRNGGPPTQLLTPQVSAARGVLEATQPGASYSVQLIEGVAPGQTYRFETDGAGVEVAILRQVRSELRLLPGYVEVAGGRVEMAPGRPLSRVVAETPFVVRVQARSPTGTDGNQAQLNISFREYGPRQPGSDCEYVWGEDFKAPIAGSRQRLGEGVTYDLRLRFRADDTDPTQIYRGHVEVTAGFKPAPDLPEQRVGELKCASAHALEVWPRIAIRSQPPDATLNPASLSKGQRGCAGFRLDMDDAERLAVLGVAAPRLRAWVEPNDPFMRDQAFDGARFSLDGEDVGYAGEASDWHAGRPLAPTDLLGDHRLCVQLGDPRFDQPSADLELTVHLVLDHSPYDDFRVIEPFVAKLRVIPVRPPRAEDFPWASLWALLLPLLLGMLLMRTLVTRNPLPPDLAFSFTNAAVPLRPAARPWRPVPAPEWWQRVLGLDGRRPLRAEAGGKPLGWLVPTRDELFMLVPARGVSVQAAATEDSERSQDSRGRIGVAVGRDYQLRAGSGGMSLPGSGGDVWVFRLGYLPVASSSPVVSDSANQY